MPYTNQVAQVGAREDLSDILAVADAKQMPFMSKLPKGDTPTNIIYSFQVDRYADPKAGGVPDGKDVDTFSNSAERRARLSARCEVYREAPMVGFIAENVQTVAGVPEREFARAKRKSMYEIKRNMEIAMLSNQESAEDNGQDGSKQRGFQKWVQSTAQSDLPINDAAYRTPAASIYTGAMTDFDEDDFRAILQSRYEQTGVAKELVLFTGTLVKNAITDFGRYAPNKASNTVIRQFNGELKDRAFVTAIDLYEGDYGVVEIIPDLFVGATTGGGTPNMKHAALVDMEFIELRTHTAPYFRPLPDAGGGPRGVIDAIVSLCVTSPIAHGKIAAS